MEHNQAKFQGGQKCRGPLEMSREMLHTCPQTNNNLPHFINLCSLRLSAFYLHIQQRDMNVSCAGYLANMITWEDNQIKIRQVWFLMFLNQHSVNIKYDACSFQYGIIKGLIITLLCCRFSICKYSTLLQLKSKLFYHTNLPGSAVS